MTAVLETPATTTTDTRSAGRSLQALAGAALVAGPVLFGLGMLTSPVADGTSKADYLASLARDETLTQASALLLHYANVAFGLGILGAATLVRGPRGRRLALVGSVLAALGFVNLSVSLVFDWFNMVMGQLLPSDQGVAVFSGVKSASLWQLWEGTMPFNLLGPLLVLIGLARAGVVRWWLAPWWLLGVVGLFTAPVDRPLQGGLTVLVGFAPLAVVGIRLIARARL